MRTITEGWRSRSSRLRGSPDRSTARRLDTMSWAAAPVTAQGEPETPLPGPPWSGVQWSMVLVGFLTYIWTVTTYAIAIGDVAMVVALIGLLFQGERFRLPPVLVVFGLFVLWGALGLAHSPFPDAVQRRLELLWKLWLIALVAVNALRDRPRIRFFVFLFLAAYAMYPIRGSLFNYFLGGYTVNGRAIWNYIYANPNDLAALTLFPLTMSAGFFVSEKKGWPKHAALLGIIITAAVIVLTGSRGGILALGVVGLASIAGGHKRLRSLIMVAVVAAVAAMAAPESVWERMLGLKTMASAGELGAVDDDGSAEQRFEFWKVAWKISRENPVAGVGVGAYAKANAVYAMSPEFKRLAGGERDAHSTYLSVLAETGFVGFTIWMTMFGMVIVRAEKLRRRARGVLPRMAKQVFFMELGLLGFFTAGIFGSFAQLSFTYIYLALLWCMTELLSEGLQRHGAALTATGSRSSRAPAA